MTLFVIYLLKMKNWFCFLLCCAVEALLAMQDTSRSFVARQNENFFLQNTSLVLLYWIWSTNNSLPFCDGDYQSEMHLGPHTSRNYKRMWRNDQRDNLTSHDNRCFIEKKEVKNNSWIFNHKIKIIKIKSNCIMWIIFARQWLANVKPIFWSRECGWWFEKLSIRTFLFLCFKCNLQ